MAASVNGLIGYFGLQDWWLNEFTERERSRIKSCYGKSTLTEGVIKATSLTASDLIRAMASFWQPTAEDELLISRLMAKADEMLNDTKGENE